MTPLLVPRFLSERRSIAVERGVEARVTLELREDRDELLAEAARLGQLGDDAADVAHQQCLA